MSERNKKYKTANLIVSHDELKAEQTMSERNKKYKTANLIVRNLEAMDRRERE